MFTNRILAINYSLAIRCDGIATVKYKKLSVILWKDYSDTLSGEKSKAQNRVHSMWDWYKNVRKI